MNLSADPEKHAARQARMKAKWNNGNGAGTPLAMAVRMPQWPTPQAHDAMSPKSPETIARQRAAGHGCSNLNEAVLERKPLWPTPNAGGGTGYMSGSNRDVWRPTLAGAVKMAPEGPPPFITADEHRGKTQAEMRETPSARDWKSGKASEETHARNSRPLNEVVERRRWPTPTKSDGEGPGTQGREGGENLRTAVGGTLNPDWTEWLLGWPPGWTACEPLGTDRFRSWLLAHGASS